MTIRTHTLRHDEESHVWQVGYFYFSHNSETTIDWYTLEEYSEADWGKALCLVNYLNGGAGTDPPIRGG